MNRSLQMMLEGIEEDLQTAKITSEVAITEPCARFIGTIRIFMLDDFGIRQYDLLG
jgi:hypothetical protein